MRNAALAGAVPLYLASESNKPNMYLDVKGLVSVGIGCRLSLDDARRLPFFNPTANRPALPDEITSDYQDVKDRKLSTGRLRLDQPSIVALATRRIMSFDGYARGKWPSTYDLFPADAQLAINSYLFATGHLDSTQEPRLCAAIDAQDWWRASAECHMSDESKGNPGLKPRNDANRRMFANAARVGFPGLNPDILYLNTKGPNKHYFFVKGGGWARYDWDDDKWDKGPIWNLDEWRIPRTFASGVTAVFSGGCNGFCDKRSLPHTGKTYFINRNIYLAYDWQTDQLDSQVAHPISDLLHGWDVEAAFANRLDAVVRGRGVWQNKLFLFSGPSYVRYDLDTNLIDWGPADLASGFKVPKGFENGIDAALNGEGKYRGYLYLFRGSSYVKYSWDVQPRHWMPEDGYVDANNQPLLTIDKGWSGFQILNSHSIIGATNAGITC
jgi:hypothetical protein